MKTRKSLVSVLLILISAVTFCACDDNDEPKQIIDPVEIVQTTGAYVLNQGSYYSNIAGSISYLDYESKTMTDSVFYMQNGILPGNTLQCGLIYGSRFYAIAYESNVLFVCDKNMKLLRQPLSVTSPRAMVADGGYLYISNYDGHVTRLDTTSFTASVVEVGPNPEEMVVANGCLYVTNSDGMNYLEAYANGKSVSKINLSSFQVEKTIPVGLNPTKIVANSEGIVFVLASGDYIDISPVIQRIDKDDDVSDVVTASMMTYHNDTIYAIYSFTADWKTYQNYYFTINTQTLERKDVTSLATTGVDVPIAIAVDPTSRHIFITSHTVGDYGPNYNMAGYVKEYDALWNYLNTYQTGVNPVQVVFK